MEKEEDADNSQLAYTRCA